MMLVPESTGPRLEKSSEGHAAVPKAAADNRLHGRFERVAQVSTRVQGVHSGLERSHRRCTIRPRVTVRPIPSVQVIKERREPGGLLSPGATRLDNDRCIQIHDSPFSPSHCPCAARCVRPDTTQIGCDLLKAWFVRYSVMVAFGSSTEGCVLRKRGDKD